MVRTQIQLTSKQAEQLRRRARQENVSLAELVRRAVDAFTSRDKPGGRELRDRAIGAAGRFASGARDTSIRHDEAFVETLRPR